MATQLFMRSAGQPFFRGESADLDGTVLGWESLELLTSRGGAATSLATNTVAGTTNGVSVRGVSGVEFVTRPLAADITISSTITFNLRAAENNMSANVAINCIVERIDCDTGAVTQIIKTARVTELGTTEAAANFTGTPTSTLVKRGDRIRVRVFGDDAGTMASGFTFTLWWNGPTAAASGDSYITFTENLTFETEPSTTALYFRDTAASGSINPGAATEKEAWTSRGAASTTAVTNSVAGYSANPFQITKTAGGTLIEWYSRPLQAFTLEGSVMFNVRAQCSAFTDAAAMIEVAVVDNDGTNPTVVGFGGATNAGNAVIINTSEQTYIAHIGVRTTSITDGRRLRFRILLEDAYDPMQGGTTITVTYDGPTIGAAGDTWVKLAQSVTEYIPPAPGPLHISLRRRAAHRFLTMR